MSLELEVPGIEVKEMGECAHCGKETIYYNTKKNEYVCSKKCYKALNSKLDFAIDDKINKVLDRLSKAIDKKQRDREEMGEKAVEAVKIFAEAITISPRDAIKYFKEKK